VVDGHLAVASQFLPRARSAAARVGEPFPSDFEQAALAFLERELGVTLPNAT
jgi:hypothetical protein